MINKCAFTLVKTNIKKAKAHPFIQICFFTYLILFCVAVKAQDSGDFEGDKQSMEFLRYLFQKEKHIGIPYDYLKANYKNRISADLVDSFLPHEPAEKPKKGYYAGEILINNDNYIALSYDKPCYQGNLCRTNYLTILDKSGRVKAHTVLGYDSSTRLKLDTMRGHIIQQRLVEKVATHVDFKLTEGGRKERENVDVKYHYKKLSSEGTLSDIPELKRRPNRDFSWSSKRLVQPQEMDEFSTRELNILRNEIFADYNFRFPSDRWLDYFSKKSWYEPKHENVNDSLNLIERFNIKRIIRFQRRE